MHPFFGAFLNNTRFWRPRGPPDTIGILFFETAPGRARAQLTFTFMETRVSVGSAGCAARKESRRYVPEALLGDNPGPARVLSGAPPAGSWTQRVALVWDIGALF